MTVAPEAAALRPAWTVVNESQPMARASPRPSGSASVATLDQSSSTKTASGAPVPTLVTVMVQVAVPSRDSSPGYREVQRETEQIVGRINGQHSEPGRVAVHYFRRSLSTEELAAYYRAADIMLVTPLRDGMNLVAKEYICCRTEVNGVLVLSEFAGAARELRQAILVNPRDLDGMRSAMSRALRMGAAERRRRMSSLRRHMLRHDVFRWASEFLKELR